MCDLPGSATALATLQAKVEGVNGAMDAILAVENEFEVFPHAHYPNLWQFTLMQAYDRQTLERIE
eukprot:10159475-Alexandrium_andersonii.AAC.1